MASDGPKDCEQAEESVFWNVQAAFPAQSDQVPMDPQVSRALPTAPGALCSGVCLPACGLSQPSPIGSVCWKLCRDPHLRHPEDLMSQHNPKGAIMPPAETCVKDGFKDSPFFDYFIW